MSRHVGDDRAGRRATARADGDAVVLRELDEVPDDQEVGVEAHPADHLELHVEALDRLGRRRVAVALAQPLARRAGAGSRPRTRRPASGSSGSASCPARSRRCSARRSPATSARPRATGAKDVRHLVGVLEVELVGVEGQLRLGERALGLDAEQRGVVVVVLAAAGSGRRRCRPAAGRPRGRSARSPRWPCPARRCPFFWTSK